MSNEDFVKLSQKKVKELNGCEDKAAYEAWRDGYNYLNKHLRAILETCYNEKFIYKLEDLCLNGPKKN